jgi:hypothetical protein
MLQISIIIQPEASLIFTIIYIVLKVFLRHADIINKYNHPESGRARRSRGMVQLQVLLKGTSWKRRAFVYLLLFGVFLFIIELWRPGTMATIPPAAQKIVRRAIIYCGEVFESLVRFAQNLGNWNR